MRIAANIRKVVALSFLVCALLTLYSTPSHGQDSPSRLSATEIKIAYLVNFARYVRWPSTAFGNSTSSIVIALEDTHPFAERLNNSTAALTQDGREIIFRSFSSLSDLPSVHILYIEDDFQLFGHIDQQSIASPILTISDSIGFIEEGGLIRFSEEDNRVVFYISRDRAKDLGLNIHYKILEMAK